MHLTYNWIYIRKPGISNVLPVGIMGPLTLVPTKCFWLATEDPGDNADLNSIVSMTAATTSFSFDSLFFLRVFLKLSSFFLAAELRPHLLPAAANFFGWCQFLQHPLLCVRIQKVTTGLKRLGTPDIHLPWSGRRVRTVFEVCCFASWEKTWLDKTHRNFACSKDHSAFASWFTSSSL